MIENLKRELLLMGVLFTLLCSCRNEVTPPQLSAVSPPTTQNLPLEDFNLPTPDSLAIRSGSIKCQQIGRIKPCGFAKAVKNQENWKGLPYLTLGWSHDIPIRDLSIRTSEHSTTALFSSLKIHQIPLAKGDYTIKAKAFDVYNLNDPQMTYVISDRCLTYATYELDSTRHSFVRILDYDPQKKQITLRFRAYFKLASVKWGKYPDSLAFDDGIIVAKAPR